MEHLKYIKGMDKLIQELPAQYHYLPLFGNILKLEYLKEFDCEKWADFYNIRLFIADETELYKIQIVNEPTGVAGTRRKKEIHRARIDCITGYYEENEKYIPRSNCLTKVYHSLVRYMKKVAPYKDFTVTIAFS